MVDLSKIQMRLHDVVNGNISIDSFDEWIAANSWNMHLDSPADAVKLVGQIELYLAEFDSGHLSESELVERFRNLVVFEIAFNPPFLTGSDSTVVSFSFQSEPSASVGRSLEMVFENILPQRG